MNKTAIIIPSRLDSVRLPNKPLELINNKEMILHVYEAAKKTNSEVFVATPDQKIIDVVNQNKGKAVLTSINHQTGTDRIYEVFKGHLNSEPNLIINLQGDMPNIAVNDQLTAGKFSEAIDFFRVDEKKYENYHHHVGIYAFTNKALVRYVSLKRSKLELERKLEQLRALENSMSIHVGYINSSPLSVDTKNDLMEVRKIMEKSN